MEPIRHLDNDGNVLVRDGLLLAFFCRQPFPTMSAGVRAAFNVWLAAIPEGALRWAMIGSAAEEAKELKPDTIDRCRKLLDPAAAQKRELTVFRVHGPEELNPAYAFAVTGAREPMTFEDGDAENNLVEIRFPVEFLSQSGGDAFVELAIRLAESMPFDSGYASLALNWSAEPDLDSAASIIVPLAMRHPGFDVHHNEATRCRLGDRCRGARWLTFLGPDLVKRLGGRDKFGARLDAAVTVQAAGAGVALRAGAMPEPGHANRGELLPLLRSVARAVEPVTYFGDDDLSMHLFGDDPDKADRWERRFLD